MDIIKPAKVTTLQTDGDGTLIAISHLQGKQAKLILCREDMSWEKENPGLISLNANECEAIAERMLGNSGSCYIVQGDTRLVVADDSRGEPFRRGFLIHTDDLREHCSTLDVFLEEGYQVERLIEVLQHCVQMEKDIVAHMQNSIADPGL
jgi:hypothetical protein